MAPPPLPRSSSLAAAALLAALFAAPAARATPCGLPTDCPSGFCVDGVCCDTACKEVCHACSAALKGGGADGVCDLVAAGSICAGASCVDPLDFIGPSICDAAGACKPPAPVSCLHNNPCKIDLCDTGKGCDQALKLDGIDCGGGLTCQGGQCLPTMATSSASGSSSGGGSGGGGGSSSSSGGAGGSGGGATSTGSSTGTSAMYPPAHDSGGCGCRVADGNGPGGVAALALGALAISRFRSGRAPARRRSSKA